MRRRTCRVPLLVAIAVGTALQGVSGCARPLWETEFRPVAGAGAGAASVSPLARSAPVSVREAPWERIEHTLEALDAEATASNIHPDDWTTDQRAAAKARLLSGLQVSGDPTGIEILGRSMFRTTDRVRPDDGTLAGFARRVGADTVVWSSTFAGKAQVVRDRPVDEFRSGTRSSWDRGSKRWRTQSYTEWGTVWVPITVEEDQYAWLAYFLRRRGS